MFNQQDILTVLNNLMGRRNLAQGTDDDLKRYCQSAYDYAWRYYKWTFSLKRAAIAEDGLLPEDFDLEGYRVFDGITEVGLADTLTSTTGTALVFDTATGRYALDPVSTATVIYQTKPPTIGDTTNCPFPSVQVLGLGAAIYAKMGENPSRADVQQEWDTFHAELDALVGQAERNRPRRTPVNRHSITGTNTGVV